MGMMGLRGVVFLSKALNPSAIYNRFKFDRVLKCFLNFLVGNCTLLS